jgi:hypothetical protein
VNWLVPRVLEEAGVKLEFSALKVGAFAWKVAHGFSGRPFWSERLRSGMAGCSGRLGGWLRANMQV